VRVVAATPTPRRHSAPTPDLHVVRPSAAPARQAAEPVLAGDDDWTSF